MTRGPRALLVLTIIAGVAALDQLTKLWAIRTLMGEPVRRFLGDTFRLGYTENTGVFLGWGDRLPPEARYLLFVIAVGATLAVVLGIVLLARRMETRQTVSIAFILGGGLSNLVDRVFRDGVVVDFMNVGVGGLRTGVFNVADMAVTGGVILLVWYGMRPQREDAPPENDERNALPGSPDLG